jgi:hypothetical protein
MYVHVEPTSSDQITAANALHAFVQGAWQAEIEPLMETIFLPLPKITV